MVKAVIFDCFGVLCVDGWIPFKRRHFGDNPALFEQVSDLSGQLNAGLVDYKDFMLSVAELAKVPFEEARNQIEGNPPNEDLFVYITNTLKPTYKIGLLSNAGANWLSDLFSREQLALFDAVTLSYEIGLTKPHPDMYKNIADKLEVAPAECIFVDDQPVFCTGAEAAGMQAIAYESVEQLSNELDKLLGK